jgi:hypothetical protein
MRRLSSDERVREVIGRSWWESFPGSEPDRVQSTSVPGSWSSVKRPVLGRLGWNSYGTEGAQPVAKVRVAARRKMADRVLNRCDRLPPFAVWIAW